MVTVIISFAGWLSRLAALLQVCPAAGAYCNLTRCPACKFMPKNSALGFNLWYKARRPEAAVVPPRQTTTHTCRHITQGALSSASAGSGLGYGACGGLTRTQKVCYDAGKHARSAAGRRTLRTPDSLLESENGRVHFRCSQQNTHHQPRAHGSRLQPGPGMVAVRTPSDWWIPVPFCTKTRARVRHR